MHSTIRRTGRAALLLAGALAASTSIAAEPEILYLSEGRVYRGELANGVPHGEGRMIWPSGAMYVAGPGSTEHATATASTATRRRLVHRRVPRRRALGALCLQGSTKIRGVKRRDRLPSEGRASVRGRRMDVQPSMSATLTPRIFVLPATTRRLRGESAAGGPGGRNHVVVVESPAKAHAIGKHLGAGCKVMATRGHVRELPARDGADR